MAFGSFLKGITSRLQPFRTYTTEQDDELKKKAAQSFLEGTRSAPALKVVQPGAPGPRLSVGVAQPQQTVKPPPGPRINLSNLVSSYQSPEDKVRALQKATREGLAPSASTSPMINRILQEQSRQQTSKMGYSLGDVARTTRDYGVSGVRDIARVPETVARSFSQAQTGIPRDSTAPTDPIRRFLYGSEPVETYQTRYKGYKEALKESRFKKAAGPLAGLGIGLVIAGDVVPLPGGKGAKTSIKSLAAAESDDAVRKLVGKSLSDDAVKAISTTKDPQLIKAIIDTESRVKSGIKKLPKENEGRIKLPGKPAKEGTSVFHIPEKGIYIKIDDSELPLLKNEIKAIPWTKTDRPHLTAVTPALKRGAKEVSREEFVAQSPNAGRALVSAAKTEPDKAIVQSLADLPPQARAELDDVARKVGAKDAEELMRLSTPEGVSNISKATPSALTEAPTKTDVERVLYGEQPPVKPREGLSLPQKLSPDRLISEKVTRPAVEAVNKALFKAKVSENPISRTIARIFEGFGKEIGTPAEIRNARRKFFGATEYGRMTGGDVAKNLPPNPRVWAALDPEQAAKVGMPGISRETLAPEEQAIFDGYKTIIDYDTAGNLQRGLIDEGQAANPSYIKRAYSAFEQGSPEYQSINKSIKAELLGSLKKRGEKVPDDLLDQAIKDPGYLVARRHAESQQAWAMVDHGNYINSTGLAIDTPRAGFVQLPNNKLYGSAGGKYVPRTLAEDFTGFQYTMSVMNNMNDVLTWYDRFAPRRLKKAMLTIGNPAVRLGNQTTNRVIFSQFNGINPLQFNKEMFSTRKWIKERAPIYREATEQGLIGTDITRADFGKRLAQSTGDENLAKKAVEWIGKSYSQADDRARLAAYSVWRKRGLSAEDAAIRVQRGFQDYKSVGFFYDLVAKTPVVGNAFVRFAGDAVRIAANAAIDHPLRSVATVALWATLVNQMSRISGESPEDKATREGRFGAPKLPGTDISLTVKTPWGEVNLARFSPFYALNDVEGQIGRFLPVQADPRKPAGWQDPLLGQVLNIAMDKDFRGVSIRDPDKAKYPSQPLPQDQQNANLRRFLINQNIPLGREADAIVSAAQGREDIYGKERSLPQAVARALGLKVEQFGPEQAQKQRETNAYFTDLDEIKKLETNLPSQVEKDIFRKYTFNEKVRGTSEPLVPRGIYDTSVKAQEMLKYPAVFEGLKKKAQMDAKRNSLPVDPLYELPKDKRDAYLRIQIANNTSPGSPESKKLKKDQKDWYYDFANKRSDYFKKTEAKFEELRSQGVDIPKRQETTEYPEVSSNLQTKLDSLETITDGKARAEFYRDNPDVTDFYRKHENYIRALRSERNLPQFDRYPTTPPELQSLMDVYSNLPKGEGPLKRDGTPSSPARSAWIQSHPNEWAAMTDQWSKISQFNLQNDAARAIYEDEDLSEKGIKSILNLAKSLGLSGGGGGGFTPFQRAGAPGPRISNRVGQIKGEPLGETPRIKFKVPTVTKQPAATAGRRISIRSLTLPSKRPTYGSKKS